MKVSNDVFRTKSISFSNNTYMGVNINVGFEMTMIPPSTFVNEFDPSLESMFRIIINM